jgi:hypothetical protein
MARCRSWVLGPGCGLLLLLSGCSTVTAYRARFSEPAYVVTPDYFERSPRCVAVFPFASRSLQEAHLERAQTCRIAFFQHFSIRDFEDVDLHALDRHLLPRKTARSHGALRQFADTIRWMDIMGLTSLLDWKEITGREEGGGEIFRTWIHSAHEQWKADAYVLGITRGYGRLYAVAFSTVGLATHVEMRSTKDDALLWSADYRSRNFSLPLTLDPMDIPALLYQIWGDSWGDALDVLAFKVYRDMVATLPPVRATGPVWVRADRPKTRLFSAPTLWTFWPRPHLPQGERLRFRLEKNGWYQCEGPDGQLVWLLCRDGTLVNARGTPLPRINLFGELWNQPSASRAEPSP